MVWDNRQNEKERKKMINLQPKKKMNGLFRFGWPDTLP